MPGPGSPGTSAALNRPYCHARARQVIATTSARPPTANRPPPLLAALLHVRPDELLGVFLEHLVDLVEDRVHVVRELFVPLLALLGGPGLGLLGLFGAPDRKSVV